MTEVNQSVATFSFVESCTTNQKNDRFDLVSGALRSPVSLVFVVRTAVFNSQSSVGSYSLSAGKLPKSDPVTTSLLPGFP
jgi:hypothetical protein